MKTKLTLLLSGLFLATFLSAQVKYHGGEIRVKQTGTYSVVATVDIFTTLNEDLQNIQLSWGDGINEMIPLVFFEEIPGSNLKYHRFQEEHIYGEEDTYTLSIIDCCLSSSFVNITQVDPVDFQISTTYFHNVTDPLWGLNEMPFFEKGIIAGNAFQLVNYTSNFVDADGDDIHMEVCDIDYLLSYNQITEVYPINNELYFDSLTGNFDWITPQLEGNYLLGICVTESRNGMVISEYTRNMVIAVDEPLSNQAVFNDDNIEVVPNPVEDQLNILMPDGEADIVVRIFDALGSKVMEYNSSSNLDVSALNRGFYVLLIETKEGLFSKKVIIK